MHAAAQRCKLRTVTLAAIDGQDAEAGHVRGVALERLGDLDRQLAGGREYEHLRLCLTEVQVRQGGQREGGGLAGAGLGLADQVAPGQQRWNGCLLDR